jgi:hypothetical protein
VVGGDARVGALVGAVPHGVGVVERAAVRDGRVAAPEEGRGRSDKRRESAGESDGTHVEDVEGGRENDERERWRLFC